MKKLNFEHGLLNVSGRYKTNDPIHSTGIFHLGQLLIKVDRMKQMFNFQ